MVPTLSPGDRVLALRPSVDRDVRPGDLVIADVRGSFLPGAPDTGRLAGVRPAFGAEASSVDALVVKRVVAVAGDRVTCCTSKGSILVNDQPLDEPYLNGAPAGEQAFDIRVEPGRLWLMGDNRASSADSRDNLGSPGGGGVASAAVLGRVVGVVSLPGASGSTK